MNSPTVTLTRVNDRLLKITRLENVRTQKQVTSKGFSVCVNALNRPCLQLDGEHSA